MSSKSIIEILGDPIPFLEQIIASLEEDGIVVDEFQLDHICYRVETLERYEVLKKALTNLGDLLVESPIGGRPIATYKLHQAIVFENRKIDCLELPAPKEGSFYKEGYEHVEFVIKTSFEDFIKTYPKLSFKTKGINKKVNPEISLKYKNFAVKFHHHTLEYVIRYLD